MVLRPTPSGHRLQALRRDAVQLSLPTGFPRNGPAVQQPLNPNATAMRRQGITNLTCRDSSQWLTANPAFIFNKMSEDLLPSASHVSRPRFAPILHLWSRD